MHLAVQQGVDKINSFQADTLLSQEIDLEINKAIDRFINLKYGKNNIYGKGFEESQKRVDDLRTVLKSETLKTIYLEPSINNTFIYRSDPLPTDYRYLIKLIGVVEYKSTCSSLNSSEQEGLVGFELDKNALASFKFVQQDDLYTLLADPFNTTKKTKPLITIEEDFIKVYTNDIFIIKKLKLTYIKNPAKVSLSLDTSIESVDCELAEHTHQEIVDMTINSILEGISDPRYKTQQLELGKNE